MPAPTLSRLTFETGARLKGGFKGRWAAERVISDTTLSLLKPASYAGTFSRDFVSRLGIGPGPFAAKRGGRDASGTSRKHRSLRSPLEAVSNLRILAWSGTRTTDSPRARSGRLHSLVLAAPAQRGPEVLFPRKRHADGFGATFCHQKVAIRRGTRRGSVFSAGQRSEHANKGCSPLFACSRRTGRRTGWKASRSRRPP